MLVARDFINIRLGLMHLLDWCVELEAKAATFVLILMTSVCTLTDSSILRYNSACLVFAVLICCTMAG
jgi:hypothetical protein